MIILDSAGGKRYSVNGFGRLEKDYVIDDIICRKDRHNRSFIERGVPESHSWLPSVGHGICFCPWTSGAIIALRLCLKSLFRPAGMQVALWPRN